MRKRFIFSFLSVLVFALLLGLIIPTTANVGSEFNASFGVCCEDCDSYYQDIERRIIEAFCEDVCLICESDEMQRLKQIAIEGGFLLDPHYAALANRETVTLSREELKELYPDYYASLIESMLDAGHEIDNFLAITIPVVNLSLLDVQDDILQYSSARGPLGCLLGCSFTTYNFHNSYWLHSLSSGVCNRIHSGCRYRVLTISICSRDRCGRTNIRSTYQSITCHSNCGNCRLPHIWEPRSSNSRIEHQPATVPRPTTCVQAVDRWQSCSRVGCTNINNFRTERVTFRCYSPNIFSDVLPYICCTG